MKFILNIDNEHEQDYSSPSLGKLLHSVHITSCCTKGNPTLEVAPAQLETYYVNTYRGQTVHRDKLTQRSVSRPGIN